MPTNNWFVWFRYLSATTYYKDCMANVTNQNPVFKYKSDQLHDFGNPIYNRI